MALKAILHFEKYNPIVEGAEQTKAQYISVETDRARHIADT
jgi:hypothetical protein